MVSNRTCVSALYARKCPGGSDSCRPAQEGVDAVEGVVVLCSLLTLRPRGVKDGLTFSGEECLGCFCGGSSECAGGFWESRARTKLGVFGLGGGGGGVDLFVG